MPHINYLLKEQISSNAARARILRRLEHQRQIQLGKTRLWAESNGIKDVQDLPNFKQMDKERRHLNNRRTDGVRKGSRTMHLAYGFLRGVPYRAMEQKCHEPPNLYAVMANVKAYSVLDERVWKQRLAEWIDEGKIPQPKSSYVSALLATKQSPA